MSRIKKLVFWIVGVYPWWPVVRDSFGAARYVTYLEANRVLVELSLPKPSKKNQDTHVFRH